jgi:hypothetical protein
MHFDVGKRVVFMDLTRLVARLEVGVDECTDADDTGLLGEEKSRGKGYKGEGI